MHIVRPIRWLVLAACTVLSVGCVSTPRIDGRSEQAFETSYARLVESLSPEEWLQLALAQLIVLAPAGCISAADSDNFITQATGTPEADIRPCREQLHQMSYKDIMDRAYP